MATRYNHVPRGNGTPLGTETVNRIGTSIDDLRTAMLVKHQNGVHHEPLIPIASGCVEWDTGSRQAYLHEAHNVSLFWRTDIGRYGFGSEAWRPYGQGVVGVVITPIDAAVMHQSRILGATAVEVGLLSLSEFRAYRSGTNQTLVDAAPDIVEFQTENFDLGSNYDNTTNYRFTAPSSGAYSFHAAVTLEDANAGAGGVMAEAYAMFYKNGVEVDRFRVAPQIVGGATNGTYGAALLTKTIHLLGSDYIDVRVYAKGSDTNGCKVIFGQTKSFFYGHKLDSEHIDTSFTFEIYSS